MFDIITIWLEDAKKTAFCGESLAHSLYATPLTIYLTGGIGAGKTTFIQGFAKGLGIKETVNSPTFALEQRYRMHNDKSIFQNELIHIDLYRLSSVESTQLIESSNDCTGIRCIEWSEKISEEEKQKPYINIVLTQENDGRMLTIHFHDIPLPSRKDIEFWRNEVQLPIHIQTHCDVVGSFAQICANTLCQQGVIARPCAVRRSGEAHDLLRFLDFHAGAHAVNIPESPVWSMWRNTYQNIKHEPACAMFLRQHGYDAIATIVEPHGLMLPPPKLTTIEQKILFYADKRCVIDQVVSLEERFTDFKKRYGDGEYAANHDKWYKEAKQIEKELFPCKPSPTL
jgi:tRNA threonylcarbamoyladenosine biosynthesis protein TsaE